MRDFRKYSVWQNAMQLTESVYELTKELPIEERFGLTSQIRRCSVSIPSNIAEGCSRTSSKEFARAFELETQLIIAVNLKMLPKENASLLLKQLNTIQRQLNALRTKIINSY
jgi:four helix bundle protein